MFYVKQSLQRYCVFDALWKPHAWQKSGRKSTFASQTALFFYLEYLSKEKMDHYHFLNAFQHLRKVDTNFLISGRRIHACLGMPNYGGKYLLMPLDCLMGLMWLKIKYDQRWRHLNKVKSVSNAFFVVFFSANLLSLKVIKRSCWFFACSPHFRSVWQDLLTCAQIFVKSPNLLVDCLMSFVVLKQPRLQDQET